MKNSLLFMLFWCFLGTLYAQKVTISEKIILKFKNIPKNPQNWFKKYQQKYALASFTKLFPQENDQELALLYQISWEKSQDKQSLLSIIQQDQEVLYAENVIENWEKMSYFPNDHYVRQNTLWSHYKTRLFEAWGIEKGSPDVIIGIIDAGTDYQHPDLKDQIYINKAELNGRPNFDDDGNGYVDDIRGYDFANQDNDASMDMESGNWHGVAVTGVCSATPDNQIGTAGTGFHARYMPLKVFNLKDQYSSVAIYEAIKYAADNNCQIINISLGNPVYARWQQEIIDYAVLKKGVLIVASAGNDNSNENQVYYPAAYRHVLSVTGSDRHDEHIGTATNHYIDLMAPGKDITSTINVGTSNYRTNFFGTSYAAPFVAGVAALVKSKFPYLNGWQIGEILRQSTDEVYHIAENAKHREKLGKGRLNAFQALKEQPFSWQAVRIENVNYQNRFGEYALREDTIELKIKLRNLLKASKNLQVQLQSLSPYAKVLDSFASLGQIGTNTATEVVFRVVLGEQLLPNSQINFRLGYSDESYNDYEYFFIHTSPHYLNAKINDISFTATANGRLGYADKNAQEGIGIGLAQESWIKEAGLMIGLNERQVANCVFSTPGNIDEHFSRLKNVKLSQQDLQSTTIESVFEDKSVIGLLIQQKITARINQEHRKYFVVEYQITNQSGKWIDSLNVGLYVDWAIGKGINHSDWNTDKKIAYAFENENKIAGIKLIAKDVNYFGTHKSIQNSEIALHDGFSTAEKYKTLSSGIQNRQVQGDIVQIVATSIKSLGVGQTQNVQFVVGLANNKKDLENSLVLAENQVKKSQKSPLPQVKSQLCNNPPLAIRPENGKKFRFYQANNLSQALHEGEFMSVSQQQAQQLFYISNIDSLVESDLLPYRFSLYQPQAFFESVNMVNALDSMTVHFYQKSPSAKSWTWDFGDASPKIMNQTHVRHTFKSLGYFKVQLQIQDSTGCQNVFAKTVSIVRQSQSPPPLLAAQYGVCAKDSLKIRPQNGTKFRFYADRQKQSLIFEGRELVSLDTNLRQVFISNIDSVLESELRTVNIRRSGIQAHFSSSVPADTVLFSPVRFVAHIQSRLSFQTVAWNFGDSPQFFTAFTTTYRYQKQGNYTITLRVIDSLGCRFDFTQNFAVGRRSPFPQIGSVQTCKGNEVILKPRNGTKFRFYADANAQNLLFEGNSYSFVAQKNTLIYVSNIDSIVPSSLKMLSVELWDTQANFEFLPHRERKQSHEVHFRNTSTKAQQYFWDFGDASPVDTTFSPTHIFKAQGYYLVSLKIIDEKSCVSQIQKIVEVFAQSPKAQIDSLMQVCAGDFVRISPKNGSWFAFYEQFPNGEVLHRGQYWDVGIIKNSKTIYVVNLDSIIPSAAQKVELRLNPNTSDFEILGNTFFEGDTIYLNATHAQARRWTWDFGNGENSHQQKTSVIYQRAGIYDIKLNTTNLYDCSSEQRRNIVVLPRLSENTFSKSVIYPNPSTGSFRIALSFGKIQQAHAEIYNSVGQLVEKIELHELPQNRQQELFIGNKGLYFLKIFVDKEIHLHKIIIH